MISFKYNNTTVALPDGSAVAYEMNNSLFNERITGAKIYNFDVLRTPEMLKLFGHPELLERTTEIETFPVVQMYLENHLWQQGTFKLKKVLPERLQFTFHSNAGEIAAQYSNASLRDLNLGSAAPNFTVAAAYPGQSHVFFPVKNPSFYADGISPDFGGIMNAWANGGFIANGASNTNTFVPFPFLLYIMNKAAQAVGFYGVRGPWCELEYSKKLVIYNNRDIMVNQGGALVAGPLIEFKNHVPDMKVGEFFRAIKNLFNLRLEPNSQTRFIEIEPANDVLARASYYDLTRAADKVVPKEKAFPEGFTLEMGQDSGDELYKEFTDLNSYIIGEGGQSYKSVAGTLFSFQDPEVGLLPYTKQPGGAPTFEQESNFTFRLLFYTGLQDGQPVGASSLSEAQGGPIALNYTAVNGLYTKLYAKWLAVLSEAIRIETNLNLQALDIINLNTGQKYRRDTLAYLIENMKSNFSTRSSSVNASMIRVPL